MIKIDKKVSQMTQYKNPPFVLGRLTEITFPDGKVKGMIKEDPDNPGDYIFYSLLEGPKSGLTIHTHLNQADGHYDLPILVWNNVKGWIKWSTVQ